ncbi:MAG TPA: hypothetical protein PKC30_09520 [Saprospiraceae bacterium]|nr:hypothetical protein [Saprospiraceae bacterium]
MVICTNGEGEKMGISVEILKIPAQYKVVVFTSSGCSHCQVALPLLSAVLR